MKTYLQNMMYKAAAILEAIVAVIIIAVIAVFMYQLSIEVINGSIFSMGNESLNIFLKNALSLVVGIEFVKMLVKHTPGNVIEVLLFATARQIIVEHLNVFQVFIGILCIAALFAIKKFLFSNFDETETILYRGSQSVKFTNSISHVNIPLDRGATLREVLVNELEAQQEAIAIGSCVIFPGVALKVAKIRDGVITRVEVIRSKHG